MRLIFTILFFTALKSNATIYYVSNTGSDAANGTSTGTAWQTISKVNASSFSAGDQILFKAGDTWNERLNIPSSGSAGNVITFGAYGTGVKPVITGFQTQGGFSNVGNIYTATATNAVKQLNTVYINGAIRAKARTPNSGYNSMSSYSNSITTVNTSLTGTPSYVGYEIVVRDAHWILDVTKITNQATGVLTVSPALTYGPQSAFGGNGWFFQNNVADLDVQNEWCVDSATKVLKVYSTTSPTVQISTIDTLVFARQKSYVTFDGLSFTGANKAALQLDTCDHIIFTNCSINNSGTLAISALKSSYVTISKDSIQNTLSGAIYMRQVDPYTPTVNTCDYAVVDSNYIKNTGFLAGMGMNSNGRYMGIVIIGASQTVTHNRIDSNGFNGIQFMGANALIKNNYLTNYCFVKDDGSAINSVEGSYLPYNYSAGGIVRSNVIVNGIGAQSGTTFQSYASGIYFDAGSKLLTADSNTIYNSNNAGIFQNFDSAITLRGNTVIDTTNCLYVSSSVSGQNSMNIKGNILYNYSASTSLIYNILSGISTIDSNYYSRPLDESNTFKLVSTTYNLQGWKNAISGDANSVNAAPSAIGITTTTPVFYYNPSGSDSTFTFTGVYYDSRSVYYYSKVVLPPYSSVLLYNAMQQAAPATSTFKRKLRSI